MGSLTKDTCVNQVVVVLAGLLAATGNLCLAINEDLTSQCIHYGPEDCQPLPEVGCHAKELPSGDHALLCCNLFKNFRQMELIAGMFLEDKNITSLHIRNFSAEALDVEFLKNYSLVSLAITDSGKLRTLTRQLSLDSLACLNLSSNALTTIEPSMLLTVRTLRYLELSNNNLSTLPNMPETNHTLGVDIFNNDNMSCHNVRETMAQKNVQFQRRGKTTCSTDRDIAWLAVHRLLLTDLELFDRLEQMCPRGDDYNCTCKPARIVQNQLNELSHFIVDVDCSRQNLTKLPDFLPNNTEVINITSNHVTSLAPLVNNPAYKDVRVLIANDNNISSILDLEGSNFIKSFNTFGLKHNNLKTLPIYILSDSFDRVADKRLYLGHNVFHCDCATAQKEKLWLIANKKSIPDLEELRCEDRVKVIDLDHSLVCTTQRQWTDYIYFIITIQVVLLLCLIGKFSYDYWLFKTTGYLPWIASKMPKMPCDWVLET